MNKKALLEWYLSAGVDEAVDDTPADAFAVRPAIEAPAPAAALAAAQPAMPPLPRVAAYTAQAEANSASRAIADRCTSFAELDAAVRAFDGCAIKKTAGKTVFTDGNPQASILLIGEAPGQQEDINGIPFCGLSGQLLDKMLASIGLDRTQVLISNTVFWRPPGNRQPNAEETAICLPFVEKLIGLAQPRLLILSGGIATHTLLQKEQSISRLRGRFYDYNNSYLARPVKTTLLYHPSYLLRQPQHKRLAWADLQMIRAHLDLATD